MVKILFLSIFALMVCRTVNIQCSILDEDDDYDTITHKVDSSAPRGLSIEDQKRMLQNMKDLTEKMEHVYSKYLHLFKVKNVKTTTEHPRVTTAEVKATKSSLRWIVSTTTEEPLINFEKVTLPTVLDCSEHDCSGMIEDLDK